MTSKSVKASASYSRLRKNVLGMALFAIALPAIADSTTGTTVTITGKPTPGKQVIATVVVTGKHLVDGPTHSVPGGDVQLMLNGTPLVQVRASTANSTVYDYGCVDSRCGLYKFMSTNTTAKFPITLPKGITSYQFSGAYTGDADSHGSTSAIVTVKPVYNSSSAAIDLLLD